MKDILNRLFNSYNKVIIGLIGVLGFTLACEETRIAYGTPSAEFAVNGQVTSKDTDKAISNIRVIMELDTTFTDIEGNYQVSNWGFPKNQTYTLLFQDTDNELNGEFHNVDTLVEFRNPDFVNGDGAWFEGTATKDFNVKLTPKK